MPAFETRDLYQKAVLWMASGRRDEHAVVLVITPVQIDVRWNDKQRLVLDKNGNTVAVDATAVVDTDIEIDSILYLIPDPDNFTLTAAFTPTSGLMQVKVFNSTPDIRNRFARKDVGMLRYNGTLPSVAS